MLTAPNGRYKNIIVSEGVLEHPIHTAATRSLEDLEQALADSPASRNLSPTARTYDSIGPYAAVAMSQPPEVFMHEAIADTIGRNLHHGRHPPRPGGRRGPPSDP